MSSSVCCHISTDMASWQLTFKTNLFVFILSESSLVVKITGAKTFVIKRIFALVISLSLSKFFRSAHQGFRKIGKCEEGKRTSYGGFRYQMHESNSQNGRIPHRTLARDRKRYAMLMSCFDMLNL